MPKDSREIIALAVVKNTDGEILIIKRKNSVKGTDGSEFTWGFPGGRASSYDNLQETVKDETLEKTGHYIVVKDMISERQHEHYPFHLHYFESELETEATESYIVDEAVVQIAWVRPNDLLDYFTTDLDPAVAKHLSLKI